MFEKLLRRCLPVVVVAALCAGAYSVGLWASGMTASLGPSLAHADQHGYSGPWAWPSRQELEPTEESEEPGAIIIGEELAFTIFASSGGLTGYERAMIVAKRINDTLEAGGKPEDIKARKTEDMAVIVVDDGPVIVTVTPKDAAVAHSSPLDLAYEWTSRIRVSLGGTEFTPPVAVSDPAVTPADQGWEPDEPYDDKNVPIISVLRGVRVGIARVSGPRSQVRSVQAVAQLETKFRNYLEIDVYVPISTSEPGRSLSRVQSVGVTGLGDLRL